jgi:DNA polymerase/3'-5' exonuclease PolX
VIGRARDSMQDPTSNPLWHYPIFWIYAVATGKTWAQIREDAVERFMRSLTTREIDRFLAITNTVTDYRSVLENFSKFLFCKWRKAGSVRRHKWTSLELALVCPENDEAIRKADFH